jgi:hypothetical protein
MIDWPKYERLVYEPFVYSDPHKLPRHLRQTPDIDRAFGVVFDYIEMFYNPLRKHAGNGMLSPVACERQQIVKAEGV